MENDEEHFSLKWSNFRSSLTEGFHDFLQEERMVDVTLAAEGKFLQAHKLVLSICSPYFKSLFDVNPCKHPIVILKDVGHHELSYMLEFMYRGEVGVKHEELPSFLKLAESLKIKGLAGERIENNDNSILSKTRPSITRVRKKKGAGSYASDYAADNNESDSSNIKQERFNRQRKRKLAVKSENSKAAQSKKVKQEKSDQEKKSFDDGSIGNIENDDDDDNPLAKLMVTKKEKQDENCKLSESSSLNLNNGLDDDDDNDDDEDETTADDFDMTPNIFNPDNSTESDQIPQGGVDYQMIQTKRGRDMLLYDGFTFTQNRMCKDGMRWQCSFPKCKAFCRMSSAGWLTPYKTNHEHPRPSEEEIKRRILRMELKARAQSSGATPGEIIRNALPAEEYQTTDQRACYTRCIQRFRKSLQRKNSKPPDDTSWSGHPVKNDVEKDLMKPLVQPAQNAQPEPPSWMSHPKPLLPLPLPLPMKEEMKHPIWTNHLEPGGEVPDENKQRHLVEQKDDLHSKIGPYGM